MSVRLMTLKASELDAGLREKSKLARDAVVRRFLDANEIVLRSITHEAQCAPQTVTAEAVGFVQAMSLLLSAPNRHQRFILNTYQTPVSPICYLSAHWRQKEAVLSMDEPAHYLQ